jgi:hypothetical protein
MPLANRIHTNFTIPLHNSVEGPSGPSGSEFT